jgi:hypothetical protein
VDRSGVAAERFAGREAEARLAPSPEGRCLADRALRPQPDQHRSDADQEGHPPAPGVELGCGQRQRQAEEQQVAEHVAERSSHLGDAGVQAPAAAGRELGRQ